MWEFALRCACHGTHEIGCGSYGSRGVCQRLVFDRNLDERLKETNEVGRMRFECYGKVGCMRQAGFFGGDVDTSPN